MVADLHCHTVKSDGATSVKDIVTIASLKGLDMLALTDHDTFDGIDEAVFWGKKLNVNICPGVEISSFDFKRNRKVHILCYYPKDLTLFDEIFDYTKAERRRASDEIIEKIIKLYPISKEMILEKSRNSTNVFKQHIMHTLADAGFTVSIYGDLFNKLFHSDEGIKFNEAKYPDVLKVLNTIKKARGIAVLAHPAVYNSYELLDELASAALIDGVEVFHSRNRENDELYLSNKAKYYNLIMTGGTDFHGMYGSKSYPLGMCTTDEEQINRIIKLRER